MTDEFYRRYLDENLDRMLEDMEKDKNHAVQQVQDGTKDKTGETSALQPASSRIIRSPAYASVEWMPEKVNKLLTFNKSLKKLRKAGYERHQRPDEFFGLIIDYMEGRLEGNLRDLAEDMLSGEGEWLSMAVEREGNLLVCYVDPENITLSKNIKRFLRDLYLGPYPIYRINGVLGYTDRKEFDIAGIPSNQQVDLGRIDDNLVRFLYGRSFSELPESIQKRNPTIYLPTEGEINPVRHGITDRRKRFSISCGKLYGSCRGARSRSYIEKKKKRVQWI